MKLIIISLSHLQFCASHFLRLSFSNVLPHFSFFILIFSVNFYLLFHVSSFSFSFGQKIVSCIFLLFSHVQNPSRIFFFCFSLSWICLFSVLFSFLSCCLWFSLVFYIPLSRLFIKRCLSLPLVRLCYIVHYFSIPLLNYNFFSFCIFISSFLFLIIVLLFGFYCEQVTPFLYIHLLANIILYNYTMLGFVSLAYNLLSCFTCMIF